MDFLRRVEQQVGEWQPIRDHQPRQRLVFTLPRRDEHPVPGQNGPGDQSTLEEVIQSCRRVGPSPHTAWIASPFFDLEDGQVNSATAALCKKMARKTTRKLVYCVPVVGDPETDPPRLAAPASLHDTPEWYSGESDFELLPQHDGDQNPRTWHAKMLGLFTGQYAGLMIGSSNFTMAGLGLKQRRNAEANLVTLAEKRRGQREARKIEELWPTMDQIADPEAAEWLGPQPDQVEEQDAAALALPAGFLQATFRSGEERSIVLHLDPEALPANWSIESHGQPAVQLLNAEQHAAQGTPSRVEISWEPAQPPEALLVRWQDGHALWPLNVEDPHALPPPEAVQHMTADDLLLILAASDPGAAFRAWSRRQRGDGDLDDELDMAAPRDLDPLQHYRLEQTFLRRIRRRARVLARLRANLERPVWGHQALTWRLRGLVGIQPLAERMVDRIEAETEASDEQLLALADLLIVLQEVNYQGEDGALSVSEFETVYRPFLAEVAEHVDARVRSLRDRFSTDVGAFWDQVVKQCRKQAPTPSRRS
jgi:hypothetical protein